MPHLFEIMRCYIRWMRSKQHDWLLEMIQPQLQQVQKMRGEQGIVRQLKTRGQRGESRQMFLPFVLSVCYGLRRKFEPRCEA